LDNLKNAITIAADGTNFTALGPNDTVLIQGNTIVITFDLALSGSTNKIKIPGGSIRDTAGTSLSSEVITECLTAGEIDECFIATAAYGSKFQTDVRLLREFRDRFLKTNPIGEEFVQFYYRHSPPIADFIADKYFIKAVVRMLLTPVVVMAYLFHHPIHLSSVNVFLGMIIIVRMNNRCQKHSL